ncbi:methionyl-tRNA formyltransferase [Candidatus Daviesbacteria bacterium]|nr:methionyl-tRNA formyltransferase [Candidatus Daviesbacteria bacterium]
MKIIFFGNTKYSIIGLKTVQAVYPILLVVTISNSPVKNFAEKLKIPVLEATRLDRNIIEQISETKPDFLLVEDYGLILPPSLLNLPKYAPLNIHHSLLPKYRGPSPAPAAILAGDKISGVTIIKMINEVDAGDILAQQAYALTSDETTESLLTKLNQLGGELVTQVIKQYLNGKAKPKKQNEVRATYCYLLKKIHGYFDIENPPPPEVLDRMIRAYYPWPGVWTRFRQGSSGQVKIVKFLPGGMLQMEGKKAISYKDFLNGYPNFPLVFNI